MTSDLPPAGTADNPHSADSLPAGTADNPHSATHKGNPTGFRSPQSPIGPGICEAAAAGLLLLLMLVPNSLLNSDGDTAHHLAVGRQILATGTLTPTDIFTQPHFGQPWLNWEWLADGVFAAADAVLGLNGVALLTAALIAGTIYGLCRRCMARGLHPVPTLVLAY